ncbi:YajG family lipoprotein [Azospirillum sp. SYSU D00513]|uniref:YajG family lipoprotein n=1 Tax=Azospirillum sp. SYSU D00513 TaxID=2812561 RepID=UPI001A96AFC8|nr:YajG family lipoprotein [Azospirillum sp. SYSU D00513]
MARGYGWKSLAAGAVLTVSFGLAGCSSTPVSLRYNAPTTLSKPEGAKPVVEVISVTDARENTARIGAIRGGYGNPLKTLTAATPVPDMVRQAFLDGLAARGLLAESNTGLYGLEIGVKRLDSSQLVRREAHTHLQLSVVEKSTGRPVYNKAIEDNRSDEGSFVETGILASVEDLRKITNDSMQAAVDQALDNPAFLAAVSTPSFPMAPAAAVPTAPQASTVEQRLAAAKALYDRKLITEREYQEQRKAILGSL